VRVEVVVEVVEVSWEYREFVILHLVPSPAILSTRRRPDHSHWHRVNQRASDAVRDSSVISKPSAPRTRNHQSLFCISCHTRSNYLVATSHTLATRSEL
jgi:hypothetical protein